MDFIICEEVRPFVTNRDSRGQQVSNIVVLVSTKGLKLPVIKGLKEDK